MGEMSAIVLDSARVYPKRLLDAGFKFEHPELKEALEDLIGRGV
jgi:NAD dependent epimerase/dehydratase family enzyme